MNRIERTHNGKYALVVDDRVVLYTSSKAIAHYYLAQATAHTSSSRYTIPLAQPFKR
jgi:hypothetical protein